MTDSIASSQVLVINCGSSSLKFALIEPASGHVVRQGEAERLGSDTASLRVGTDAQQLPRGAAHADALERVLELTQGTPVTAVGHRVVHGGEAFSESTLLDDGVIQNLRECTELAPLHNPANLKGIEAARKHFPNLPHVAVFDTAFHHTLPPKAFLYALPYELYERQRVRRYGFHGTSHRFVALEAARLLGKPLEELQLITAHLGNGCSACAVKAGQSVDTSMGFTPLEGLVMGTRSGDVDPNLHQFLVEHTGRTLTQVTALLNRESGLLGLSGRSNDMRTLLAARDQGDARAALAIEVFCYRLAKAILALSAALTRIDALVFTGGIGEHAAPIRAETLRQLQVLGAEVDADANADHGAKSRGRVSPAEARLCALVVPTNEELMIARETARVTNA